MIRRPPRSTLASSSAASDVYKRQIQDIVKTIVDKGKSQTPKEKVGESHYNKGVYNSVMIAESIRNAQKLTGKKIVTGEDVRRGLETMNITAASRTRAGQAPS